MRNSNRFSASGGGNLNKNAQGVAQRGGCLSFDLTGT